MLAQERLAERRALPSPNVSSDPENVSLDDVLHSKNVVWDSSIVLAEDRLTPGGTVWLTGLPASGKSTLAKALEARLLHDGCPAARLDGDNLRHGLCGDLGFTMADREENVRRIAHVAKLLAEAGVLAVVAVVSPYEESRQRARSLHEDAGLRFVEVFVDTPLAVCESRDPKGLFARARAGELAGMTGIDDPYEPVAEPELHLRHPWSVEDAVERLVAMLRPALSAGTA